MIAATALANGLPVDTCSADDLNDIARLEVVPCARPTGVGATSRAGPAGGHSWHREVQHRCYT